MGTGGRSGTQCAVRRAAIAEEAPRVDVDSEVNVADGCAPAPSEGGGEVERAAAAAAMPTSESQRIEVQRIGYAPIVRVDANRREIELCATSEAIDSYGTIFSYEASKKAFAHWLGNVREMHERKAVGRRVAVRFDDDARKVFVTIRISRGAQDTWEKVRDGTLRGASIGAANVTWEEKLWPGADGKKQPSVAIEYDLVELSLVDNPSNPDALGVTFVRDAMPDVWLLDRLDAEPETDFNAKDAKGSSVIDRGAGGVQTRARDQALDQDEQQGGLGIGSERLHAAARAVLQSCGCIVCEAAMASLAEEIDAATDDEMDGDEDAQTLRAQEPALRSRWREATLVRALQAGLRVSLNSSARRLDTLDAQVHAVHDAVNETGAALRYVGAQVSRVAESVEETAARATGSMGELERRLERLEAQPMPGGPAARAVEKTHPLHLRDQGRDQWRGQGRDQMRDQSGYAVSMHEQYRALEALAGRIADPQAQVAVAAELIRLQREIG